MAKVFSVAMKYSKRMTKRVATMTGLDIAICLDHAAGADPLGRRGQAWLDAFFDKAYELGFGDCESVACTCGVYPHRPECCLVTDYKPSPVWPHDETENPSEGLIQPGRAGRIVPVCPKCGTNLLVARSPKFLPDERWLCVSCSVPFDAPSLPTLSQENVA